MTPLEHLYESQVFRLEDLFRRESEVRDHPDRHVRKQAIQTRLQAEAEAEMVLALHPHSPNLEHGDFSNWNII